VPVHANLESFLLPTAIAGITIGDPSGSATAGTIERRSTARIPDMSEHWPVSSANGTHAEDAVGVADRSVDDRVVVENATADASPADAELIDATATTDEQEPADHAAAATADLDEAAADAPASDDAAAAPASAEEEFLAELARAMQATVAVQRVRIVEDAERRRQAHVEQVRAREAAEADRMRELAAEDMKAIESWADGERKRIQLERHRRATELHEDLDLSLAEHRSKIDREIEGVETAIAAYRAEVEAFFDGLDRETDVVVIAQQASWRPVFPTLDLVGEAVADPSVDATTAEPSATDESWPGSDDGAPGAEGGDGEPAVVGVMDPEAPAEPTESWTAPTEVSSEPVPAEASAGLDDGEAAERAEPVTATFGANHNAVSSLFESVQVLRPMAWLRREANGGDHSSH
jgi:hypothetical protein